ncbi:MAG: ABC transporter ATP-binding protein [Burkholderiales bacterium]|nr:ABC transporter ATP-binding protein [Burkholderiales bacterium]
MNNKRIVLEAVDLKKTFSEGNQSLEILKGVNLQVYEGEVVAVVGTSGSGKTTLLQCLGGLDNFNSGKVLIDGHDISKLSEKEITRLRNKKLGFVYQFHHLLPEFTALENVAMPLRIRRDTVAFSQKRATELLDKMGLKERLTHLPGQLSGGEKQRVSIARAAVGKPVCLLADEPTGNLDQETATSVFEFLLSLAADQNIAVVLVTHDLDLASQCGRIVSLKGGVLKPYEGK